MSDLLDVLLILDRLQARMLGPAPPPALLPGDYMAPGPGQQRSLFNGTATVTQTTPVQLNLQARAALFSLSIAAASGTTPTLNVKVQGVNKDGVAYDLPNAAFAQQTGVATATLIVGPGFPATAGVSANTFLPMQFQVVQTIAGTTPSFTYDLCVDLI